MSGRSLTLFALALTLVTVTTAHSNKDEETLGKIANYRSWSRVTRHSFRVDMSSVAG